MINSKVRQCFSVMWGQEDWERLPGSCWLCSRFPGTCNFFKISKKNCPEAKEGKLFSNFFFDRMIIYDQEGMKKYSSNEISILDIKKNHPSAQCFNNKVGSII